MKWLTLQDKKGALATTKATAAKRHLKTRIHAFWNFIPLIPFYSICQMLANFLGVDSEGLCLSLEKEHCSPVFTSLSKRETWKFHAAFEKQRQKMYKKAWCMHVQNCCCANLTYSLFCCSRCRRSRRCLSSLRFQISGSILVSLQCSREFSAPFALIFLISNNWWSEDEIKSSGLRSFQIILH